MAWVKHLLAGYGVLTKDIAAEFLPWSWDAVYGTLKQLEIWGVLTRGLWIEDIPALQFAERETVRELHAPPGTRASGITLLPSTDPANPYGLTVRWPSANGPAFARKAGHYLLLKDGRWSLWIENNGRRIYTMPEYEEGLAAGDESPESLKSAAQSILAFSGTRKVVIDAWNKTPVTRSEAAETLRRLGAEADRDAFVLWPSVLR
ncbi:hypothetical protein LJK87_27320 [Paenibacillus sp. P25]|nr:hypothetical protein LJK87_27320 [Paenibacillus sp. P25]